MAVSVVTFYDRYEIKILKSIVDWRGDEQLGEIEISLNQD